MRSSTLLCGAMVLGPVCSAAADQTLTLQAVQDTSIYVGTPGAEGRADGSGDYLWLSVTAEGLNRRMLVKFDLGAVPAGAVVRAVNLTLYESRARDEHDVALHRLLSSWGEGASNGGGQGTGAEAQPGDATWISRFHPGVPWLAPGGDFDPLPSAVQRVGLPNTTYTWSGVLPATDGPPRIVSDVQGWVQNPASNHGWIFIGAESALQNAKRFESRNNAVASLRPKLTVVYTPAAAGADGADVPLPPWALLLLGAALLRLYMRRSVHE